MTPREDLGKGPQYSSKRRNWESWNDDKEWSWDSSYERQYPGYWESGSGHDTRGWETPRQPTGQNDGWLSPPNEAATSRRPIDLSQADSSRRAPPEPSKGREYDDPAKPMQPRSATLGAPRPRDDWISDSYYADDRDRMGAPIPEGWTDPAQKVADSYRADSRDAYSHQQYPDHRSGGQGKGPGQEQRRADDRHPYSSAAEFYDGAAPRGAHPYQPASPPSPKESYPSKGGGRSGQSGSESILRAMGV